MQAPLCIKYHYAIIHNDGHYNSGSQIMFSIFHTCILLWLKEHFLHFKPHWTVTDSSDKLLVTVCNFVATEEN